MVCEISKTHIFSLLIELLYDTLDYLSVEDVGSFVFCRWDLFLSSVEFLKRTVGPSIRNLGGLITLFARHPWPKSWLQCIVQHAINSEPSILRDIDSLIAVNSRTNLSEDVFQEIVRGCTEYNWPIFYSMLNCRSYEAANQYLIHSPCAILTQITWQ
jgi:hypothetical protein